MPGSTPIYGFPYPEPSDLVANYPALGQELAEDIEAVLPTLGGITLVTSNTFSAVASVSINNCFTSTYLYYRLIATYVLSSSNQNVRIRLRAGGTDNSANEYSSSIFRARLDGSTAPLTTVTTQGLINASSVNRSSISTDIINPQQATPTLFQGVVFGQDTTNLLSGFQGIYHNVSTAFDGFTIYPDAGTMTGTLKVYGYKN